MELRNYLMEYLENLQVSGCFGWFALAGRHAGLGACKRSLHSLNNKALDYLKVPVENSRSWRTEGIEEWIKRKVDTVLLALSRGI